MEKYILDDYTENVLPNVLQNRYRTKVSAKAGNNHADNGEVALDIRTFVKTVEKILWSEPLGRQAVHHLMQEIRLLSLRLREKLKHDDAVRDRHAEVFPGSIRIPRFYNVHFILITKQATFFGVNLTLIFRIITCK
jgi:hypothetical protein